MKKHFIMFGFYLELASKWLINEAAQFQKQNFSGQKQKTPFIAVCKEFLTLSYIKESKFNPFD